MTKTNSRFYTPKPFRNWGPEEIAACAKAYGYSETDETIRLTDNTPEEGDEQFNSPLTEEEIEAILEIVMGKQEEARIWQGKSQDVPNAPSFGGSWIRLVHGRKYNLTIRKRPSGLIRVDVREPGFDDYVTIVYESESHFNSLWSKIDK